MFNALHTWTNVQEIHKEFYESDNSVLDKSTGSLIRVADISFKDIIYKNIIDRKNSKSIFNRKIIDDTFKRLRCGVINEWNRVLEFHEKCKQSNSGKNPKSEHSGSAGNFKGLTSEFNRLLDVADFAGAKKYLEQFEKLVIDLEAGGVPTEC